MLGSSRVYVRLDVSDARGRRSITIVESGGSDSFRVGEPLHAFFLEPWLADMRRAAGKVGVTILDPVTIVVERIEPDEMWCVVKGDAISSELPTDGVAHPSDREPPAS